MASSKRKSDDSDSDWEGAPGAKQPKPTPESGTAELQKDLGNYGSASSQRPARVRKPPERYINAPPQPPISKRKKATLTKTNSSAQKASTTARGASHQIQAEVPAPLDTIANGIDSSSQLPEKESKIVCLKVPFTTSTRQPSQKYDNESSGSDLSSPPGSLPSTPVCTTLRPFGHQANLQTDFRLQEHPDLSSAGRTRPMCSAYTGSRTGIESGFCNSARLARGSSKPGTHIAIMGTEYARGQYARRLRLCRSRANTAINAFEGGRRSLRIPYARIS